MRSGRVTSTHAPPWVYAAAAVLGAALLGLPQAAFAQTGSFTVDISVRVTDVNNEQPIHMVRVDLLQFPDRFVRQGISDSLGQVEFPGIRSQQSYVLRAFRDGYHATEMEFDTVRGERSKRLYISLRPVEKKGPTAPGNTVSAKNLAVPAEAVKEFREGLKQLNEKKDARGSVPMLLRAIELAPQFYDAHVVLGLAHLQMQALEEAEKCFTRAMELEPKLVPPYHPLATILITQKRYGEAEKVLQRAQEIDPRGWQWPFELARSQAMQRNWEKAIAHGKQALAANNVPTKIHLLMADIYSNAGQVELAAAELDAFEKLDPQSPYMPKVRAARAQLKKPTP